MRLDGLPLAIELAAPRVRALPRPRSCAASTTASAADRRPQDLVERQRTLRATIEWSYELLLSEEKALFPRLGVFVGGCRPQAAEALCDP